MITKQTFPLHRVALFLENSDLKILAKTSQKLRDTAIEHLIHREEENLPDIHSAAYVGNSERVGYFLNLGISVDRQSATGYPLGWNWTPLQIAANAGQVSCLELLLSHHANVHHKDPSGFEAIHRAADSGNVESVELLLKAGADPNAANEDSINPLMLALDRIDGAPIIQALLKANANPRCHRSFFERFRLPLQMAIGRKNLIIAKVLLDHDPTLIDARFDVDGKIFSIGDLTALHIAVMDDYEEGVKFLLEHHADVNIETYARKTALDLVKQKGSAVDKLLCKYRRSACCRIS